MTKRRVLVSRTRNFLSMARKFHSALKTESLLDQLTQLADAGEAFVVLIDALKLEFPDIGKKDDPTVLPRLAAVLKSVLAKVKPRVGDCTNVTVFAAVDASLAVSAPALESLATTLGGADIVESIKDLREFRIRMGKGNPPLNPKRQQPSTAAELNLLRSLIESLKMS